MYYPNHASIDSTYCSPCLSDFNSDYIDYHQSSMDSNPKFLVTVHLPVSSLDFTKHEQVLDFTWNTVTLQRMQYLVNIKMKLGCAVKAMRVPSYPLGQINKYTKEFPKWTNEHECQFWLHDLPDGVDHQNAKQWFRDLVLLET
jgi:hypothetical protein